MSEGREGRAAFRHKSAELVVAALFLAVGAALQRGCYQVMALTAPYLVGQSRALFEQLAGEYLHD